MTPRLRKAIGGVLMLVFLLAYVIVAVNIGDHLPSNKAVKLAYYLVVGTAWGAPLIPLITWMNRGG
jgi:hypothetical protein